MKNAKPKRTTRRQPKPSDPYMRLDIAASRVVERLMSKCKDPALVFLYAKVRPGLEEFFADYLGPVKTRRKRAR